MNSGRLIAIGDVHGCAHALEAVLAAVAPQPSDELVFLGDLIDQGADSRGVLDQIVALRGACRVVLIQGNHEEMLFRACEHVDALRFWERCGGVATINSYRFGGKLDDLPAEHWRLLVSCRPYYEHDEAIFTHASFDPELPLSEHPGHVLRWDLFDPDELRPHQSGKPVFVGHTEQRSGEVLDLGFAVCLDTSAWRYGWLTAIDVRSRRTWQASRWGVLREAGQATPGDELAKLLRAPS